MRLHHSGFVVDNIERWESNMIFEEKVNDVFDPVQHARLCLYRNHSDSFIELIQPTKDAFTWNSLQKNGNHFNHFCYEVADTEEMKQILARTRMILVLGPVPALLFEGRQICFYYNKNRQVVEFLLNKI